MTDKTDNPADTLVDFEATTKSYAPVPFLITEKQVAKHLFLCDRFNSNVQLPDGYVITEDEDEAQSMGAWFGEPRNDKPGAMYIAILPDGSSHS